MVSKKNGYVEVIIKALTDANYTVAPLKSNGRYQVKSPDGKSYTFMPSVLTEDNYRAQLKRLQREVGFDFAAAEAALEQERLERIQAADAASTAAADAANRRRIAEAARTAHIPTATFIQPAPPVNLKEEPVRIVNDNAPELAHSVDKLAVGAVWVGQHRFKEVTLDAELAAQIRQHNHEYRPPTVVGLHTKTNRPLHSMHTLRGMAYDIVNGNWPLIPHGMAFDSDANLIDGQNRVEALLIAHEQWENLLDPRLPDVEERAADLRENGVRIPMILTFDWDPDSTFAHIDRGKTRSLADLLAITGETDRNNLGTIARMIYAFDLDPEVAKPDNMTDGVLLDFVKANQPWLYEALAEARPLRRSGLMITGVATGIFLARRAWPQTPEEIAADGDQMGDFINGLVTGENLSGGDPRLAALNWLRSHPKENRRTHLALFLKTWNAWLDGRQVAVMQLGRDRTFPVPKVRPGYVLSVAAGRYVPDPSLLPDE